MYLETVKIGLKKSRLKSQKGGYTYKIVEKIWTDSGKTQIKIRLYYMYYFLKNWCFLRFPTFKVKING